MGNKFRGGMPGMGNMGNMMKQMQKMQRQMEETQKRLEETEVTATSVRLELGNFWKLWQTGLVLIWMNFSKWQKMART